MTSRVGINSDRLGRLTEWDEDTFDDHFDDLRALANELGSNRAIAGQASRLGAESSEDLQALAFDLLAAALTPDDRELVPVIVDLAGQIVVAAAGHDLRWSVAHALAAANDERALSLLIDFASDPEADVRWQVTYGIPTGLEQLPEPVVDALLRLMRDDDSEVRDWATFALGIQSEMDSPAIRAALAAAIEDVDPTVSEQGALALAQREDSRGLPMVREGLQREDVSHATLDGAIGLADPSLLPLLEQVRANGWRGRSAELFPWLLDEAIEACQPPSGQPE